VLFRRRARFEGAEIAALAGFGIHFSGLEPVLARRQFTDHGISLLPSHDRTMRTASVYGLPCGGNNWLLKGWIYAGRDH
jgi:hypothetical protein